MVNTLSDDELAEITYLVRKYKAVDAPLNFCEELWRSAWAQGYREGSFRLKPPAPATVRLTPFDFEVMDKQGIE